MAVKKVAILGAGYAGMFLAMNLDNHISSDEAEIVLVNRKPTHSLRQEIHLVAAGLLEPNEVVVPISRLIEGKNIKFVQATVKELRPTDKKVVLDSGELEYDTLIVALGASTEYFNIEGAEENTVPLRSLDDARRIKEQFESIINSSAQIVIGGGGATGMSIAGALSERLKKNSLDDAEIFVLEALPEILPGWDKGIVSKTREILESRGVKIVNDAMVETVEPNHVITKDGRKFPSSLTIWTAGVKAYEIPSEPPLEKAKNGRIIVNEYLQNEQFPDIFALGDIAAVKDSAGKVYPPLAQIAIRQAKYLGDAIGKYFIHDKRPLEKFDYDIKAQILSLGEEEYIGKLNGFVVTGNIASMVKDFIEYVYRESLKSGGRNVSAKMYEDDILSQAIAGVTFAGFSFIKALRKLS